MRKGLQKDKISRINNYVMENFEKKRLVDKENVHDEDLRKWGIEVNIPENW